VAVAVTSSKSRPCFITLFKEVKMNVERLHVIAKAIRRDLTQSNSLSLIAQLISALQNQINQPQEPQYQIQTSQTITALTKGLNKAISNEFAPTWRQVIEEIGANPLLGNELNNKIEEIFSRNQITPSVALQEIQVIHTAIQALVTSTDQLLAAFQNFHVESEELKAGECEIGVIVPRAFVDNRLDKFADELAELDKIFETFAEVATGSRPGFHVKTISSSELTVFIESAPSVAACIAIAIERIVALYKQLLEIRKLKNELTKQGLDNKQLVGVDEHANSLMDEGIEKLITELLTEFFKDRDKARKNELTIGLRFALKRIANRIDRGFNIEVRAEPIKEDVPADDAQQGSTDTNPKYYSAIEQSAKTLQFMKLEGSPILNLSESEEGTGKAKK